MVISAEGKISIGLTLLLALGSGVVMIAPEQQVWIGWAIIAVATLGLVALVIYHFATRPKKSRKETMDISLSDVGLNASLAAGAVSAIAAFKHAPKIAIAAALIAWVGIGIDYWSGPQRGFIWEKPKEFTGSDSLRTGLQGRPLGWSRLYINNTVVAPSGKPMNITNLSIMGGNVGDKEIKLDDAYFLSGIDGTRLNAKIAWAGAQYKIQEIKPIPAGAFLFIISEPIGPPNVGLLQNDFLNKWAIVAFIATYNGTEHRTTFDQSAMKSFLPKPLDPYPHISPIKDH
jgi:hypothetical protein